MLTDSGSTLEENRNYKLHVRASDTLWVFLSPRGMPSGQFAYYQRSSDLSCSRLFVSTLREDFYQGMFDDLSGLIERLRCQNKLTRIFYWGFSAGAYAALLLGLRGQGTARITAFAPQFKLDQPLTIAHRTVKALEPGGMRFNPRFSDITNDLGTANVPCDIFLGAYEFADGIMIEESFRFYNSLVNCHYLRSNHNVGEFLARRELIASVFKAVQEGRPVVLPNEVLATDQDTRLAIQAYHLAKQIECDGSKPSVPEDEDNGIQNPAWWNVKARVRIVSGDLAGALADFLRAAWLEPEVDGHWICAANVALDMGFVDIAEVLYSRAARLTPESWGAQFGLAKVFADQGKNNLAEAYCGAALLRNAPREVVDPILRKIGSIGAKDR